MAGVRALGSLERGFYGTLECIATFVMGRANTQIVKCVCVCVCVCVCACARVCVRVCICVCERARTRMHVRLIQQFFRMLLITVKPKLMESKENRCSSTV